MSRPAGRLFGRDLDTDLMYVNLQPGAALKVRSGRLSSTPDRYSHGKQGQRKKADEPSKRRIAIEHGLIGIGGVDVTGYGRARPVSDGEVPR